MSRLNFSSVVELRAYLAGISQEHLLAHVSNDVSMDHPLIQQIINLNIEQTLAFFKKASQEGGLPYSVEPVPREKAVDLRGDPDEKKRIEELGKQAIRDGKVAAVILSGGQGTRLGFSGPKGMYDIGLPSKKSIFQLHFESIIKVASLAEALTHPPVYIMTSDLNDTTVREFFKLNDYFGYPSTQVFFFEQGLQPCISNDSKILLETPDKISMAPDGNGGIYLALSSSGAIDDMERRGVMHVHVYGIDNVLTKALDPVFIGACIDKDVEVGNKVVWRANKSEKVGVTASENGRMRILEYSEIPSHLAEAEDETGKLVFGAANICNHYCSLQFLREKVLVSLIDSYHIARKKIPFYDPVLRQSIAPTSNNGVKLEIFIFDVFPLAAKWLVMEVSREEEFAPVKNEPGNSVDSPDTARWLLSEQAKRWLLLAGATLVDGEGREVKIGLPETPQKMSSDGLQCEISRLLSYEGENLEFYKGKVLTLPLLLP